MKDLVKPFLFASALGLNQPVIAGSFSDLIKTSPGLTLIATESVGSSFKGHLVGDGAGRKQIVITDFSEQYMVKGEVVDLSNQSSVNQFLIEKLNPPKPFEDYLSDINASKWVLHTQNPSLPTIYMFSETLCPYCSQGHKLLKSTGFLDDKEINVAVIPMAFHEGAENVWAYIYGDKEPVKKLEHFYANYGKEEITMGKTTIVSSEVMAGLRGAAKFSSELGVNSTPTYFYKKDGKFQKIMLSPDNAKSVLSDLKKSSLKTLSGDLAKVNQGSSSTKETSSNSMKE